MGGSVSDQQSGGCLLEGGGTQAPFWPFHRAHWDMGGYGSEEEPRAAKPLTPLREVGGKRA